MSVHPTPPDVAGVPAYDGECRIDDEDGVELERLVLEGRRIVGLALDRPQVSDVLAQDCDLAGVTATNGLLRRAALVRTRLRDCTWGGGLVQDVTIEGGLTPNLSLRFSTLQRVIVSDCDLTGADFYGATFDRVLFERCELAGGHFDGCTVKELTLRHCGLLGVTGALSLKGATVDLDDLAALAPSLAREAGLRLA